MDTSINISNQAVFMLYESCPPDENFNLLREAFFFRPSKSETIYFDGSFGARVVWASVCVLVVVQGVL